MRKLVDNKLSKNQSPTLLKSLIFDRSHMKCFKRGIVLSPTTKRGPLEEQSGTRVSEGDKVVAEDPLIPPVAEEVVRSTKPADTIASIEIVDLVSESASSHRPVKEPVEPVRKMAEETAPLHEPQAEGTIGEYEIKEREGMVGLSLTRFWK
ncbi:uncharacterized protein A4U43_C06F19570 [Asparagus officinalis]|uniref:Uncharacterized protein n=1 Tax=Asparagus officinalis TaxID=4686 RepID=A0A5P1ETJ6_ASPOF|nr:uncharacterized protein A4U43_C06F19570 [Asparagus officinalis]